MKIEAATFCVVDTETTGLDPEKDELVELGWVLMLPNPTPIEDWGNTLVNPGVPIPATSSAIHHLTDDDVSGFPAPNEALDFLPDAKVLAAHNAPFDRAMLEAAGLPGNQRWLCTRRLAMHLLPDAPSHSNQVLRYHLGLDVSHDWGPMHRALPDAMVTAHLLHYMLEQIDHGCDTVDQLIELADSPVELRGKLNFGKHADKTWDEVPTDYLQCMHGAGFENPDVRHTVKRQLEKRKLI